MATAAQLAARRRLVAAATKRHPPRPMPPAQLPRPTAYTRALTAIADELNQEIHEALADEGLPAPRADAADGDASIPAFNREGLLARLRRIAEAVVKRRGGFLDTAIQACAANVSSVSRAEWSKQAKAAVGIDLAKIEPNLTPTINSFRRANLDLITSMARDKIERVKAILEDAPNARVETIRDRILEEGNVTRRQAALIARDQVLSLNAQVAEKRHAAAGVEKYTWRTSGDGDVRPAHRALNGKVFAYADPPVVDAKKGRRENPGQDYQCLPGDAPLRLAPGVVRAYRRWYSGELTTLVTDSGEALHATPNHPVLTRRGWVPAQFVDVGDDVFSTQVEPFRVGEGDPEHRQPTMQQVFDTLAALTGAERARSAGVGFHGDAAINEEVDVVWAEGGLSGHIAPERAEAICQHLLAIADANTEPPGPGVCDVLAVLQALGYPAHRVVRGLGEALAFRGFRVRHADAHCFAASARIDSDAGEAPNDAVARDAESSRQREHALALLEPIGDLANVDLLRVVGRAVRSDVDEAPSAERLAEVVRAAPASASDLGQGRPVVQRTLRVVQKLRREYSAHVYNLETAAGWFDSTLITHNCRCTAEPIIEWGDGDPAAPR